MFQIYKRIQSASFISIFLCYSLKQLPIICNELNPFSKTNLHNRNLLIKSGNLLFVCTIETFLN